jgi:hypothetical protein
MRIGTAEHKVTCGRQVLLDSNLRESTEIVRCGPTPQARYYC